MLCSIVLGEPEDKNGEDMISEFLYHHLVLFVITLRSGVAVKEERLFLTGLFLSLLKAGWQFE